MNSRSGSWGLTGVNAQGGFIFILFWFWALGGLKGGTGLGGWLFGLFVYFGLRIKRAKWLNKSQGPKV